MINLFVLEGRLTRDPEMRYTPSGKAMLKFAIANNNGYGDYKKTLFMDCVLFGNRAEALEPYLHKGERVTVYGKLNANDWTTSNGEKRRSYSVNVDEISLNSKNSSNKTYTPSEKGVSDDDIPF